MAAAVLSAAVDAANDATSALVSVTTTLGTGTLYSVVTTSATTPSHAQIVAGQDNLGAAATWVGTKALTASGAHELWVTGLTASTAYTAHFTQINGLAEASTPVSANGLTTPQAWTSSVPARRRGSDISIGLST